MHKSNAIFLLVHQGLSYLPYVHEQAEAQGYDVIVLSSKPVTHAPIHGQKHLAKELNFANELSLEWQSVEAHLTRYAEHYNIVGVLSTFEGYRLLMARANQFLGIADCELDQLELALDKYSCRNKLRESGLSEVECHLLTETKLAELKQSADAYFFKPRSGVGSFGCFRPDKNTNWDLICSLTEQLSQDDMYKSAFFEKYEFIAESYISGVEVSFEIVALDGKYYTLAIHEKAGIENQLLTVLETTDVSPAISLSVQEMVSGSQFIHSCLAALELHCGGFHIEAKYERSSTKWEVIEVNPRIGGGLINQSVKTITSGISILDAWILVLTRHHHGVRVEEHFQSLDESFSAPQMATITDYAFGEPGRTIAKLNTSFQLGKEPIIFNIAVKENTELPNLQREIAIAEALWEIEIDQLKSEYSAMEKNWIRVEYL